MNTYVILLRAIGPITHKVMSMTQWRDGVAAAGFAEPATYLATGNMIATGPGTIETVAGRMNRVVRDLGLAESNVAVVRRPAELRAVLDANPFPEAAADRPSQMQVFFFADRQPDFSWTADHGGPELFAVVDGHLVVDYSGRISESSRLGNLIEKRCGPGTGRNWNTLKGLVERATAREEKDT
ncbi:MAG: DUF1697 domain-containing protein [Devosia nanyangense]|jgi:uncharacterized protein (DUF1697 family)|nr:DUF1697 domain-containing protein [Devosia nanyangense]